MHATRHVPLVTVHARCSLLCLARRHPVVVDRPPSRSRTRPRRPPIRSTDRHLRALIDDGVRTSPTLRALVERLDASDVVVYVQCDGARARRDGHLTFLAAAGGSRYVRRAHGATCRGCGRSRCSAHELQHAVEIADAPAIVDGASLAREYQTHRLCQPVRARCRGVAFDTEAAVRAGEQVLKELMRRTID